MNLLPAQAADGGVAVPALGGAVVPCAAPTGRKLIAGFRPQALRVEGGTGHVVEMTEALGGVSFIHAAAPGQPKLVIETAGDRFERPGAPVAVVADPAALHLFDAETGARLR
jgi:lactose/L-arabinose transport system ATP-binding protein